MDKLIKCAKCSAPEKLQWHMLKGHVPLIMCPEMHIICLKCLQDVKEPLSGCIMPNCTFEFKDKTHPFPSNAVIQALQLCDIDWAGRLERFEKKMDQMLKTPHSVKEAKEKIWDRILQGCHFDDDIHTLEDWLNDESEGSALSFDSDDNANQLHGLQEIIRQMMKAVQIEIQNQNTKETQPVLEKDTISMEMDELESKQKEETEKMEADKEEQIKEPAS